MPAILRALFASAILAPCYGAADVWVGFRYDTSHVLFYPSEMTDSAEYTQQQAEQAQLPQPMARWGGGGYLRPLSSDRLATFQPSRYSKTGLPGIHPGDKVRVLLASDQSITATAERYVEQWGCPEPAVEVGVLARVLPDQLGRFHAMKVDYFLVYRGSRPLRAPVVTRPDFIIESRRVLNDFGSVGEIVLESGYEGWSVTLFRTINHKFVPTAVTYYYGC